MKTFPTQNAIKKQTASRDVIGKVWSRADENGAECWSTRREDDTRFILESWKDEERSRRWGKDKERYARAVSVPVFFKCLWQARIVTSVLCECRYVILKLARGDLGCLLGAAATDRREEYRDLRWHTLEGQLAQMRLKLQMCCMWSRSHKTHLYLWWISALTLRAQCSDSQHASKKRKPQQWDTTTD